MREIFLKVLLRWKAEMIEKFFSLVQFNFVGKLLGPKGNSMKRLQEETMCKMAVLGRGSMKDRKKVRNADDEHIFFLFF